MKKLFLATLCACITFASCNNEQTERHATTGTDTPAYTQVQENDKYRNGISIKENGLTVRRAFLTDDGQQALSGTENKTGINEKIHCQMEVDGWTTDKNGKVSVGASEKVIASDGSEILNESDLFANIGAVSPEDARFITLTAVITELRQSFDYFDVQFRVWDKNSQKSLDGKYRFRIR